MRIGLSSILFMILLSVAVFAVPSMPPPPDIEIFEDGGIMFANHCYNGLQDADESDIDCGGSCLECTGFNWLLYVLVPLMVVILVLLVAIIVILLKQPKAAPIKPIHRTVKRVKKKAVKKGKGRK